MTQDLLHRYLHDDRSSLLASLNAARALTGQRAGTPHGDLLSAEQREHLIWPGALQYLSALDALGGHVRRVGGPGNSNGIDRALALFASDIDEQDRQALRRLRNGLSHSFSVAKVRSSGFAAVVNDPARPLFPEVPTLGRCINFWEVGVLVERIYDAACEAAAAGDLELTGEDDLFIQVITLQGTEGLPMDASAAAPPE